MLTDQYKLVDYITLTSQRHGTLEDYLRVMLTKRSIPRHVD